MLFPTCFALISGIFYKVPFSLVLTFSGRKPYVSVFNFQGATGLEMELRQWGWKNN
jgi:hypothetical protein